MAATSDNKPRPNEPADEIILPADLTEATRWVYSKAQRLMKNRAWHAAQIKDHLQAAKAGGCDTKAIRLASRLQRMTPEKRQSWEEQVNGAAAILGYSPLSLDAMPAKSGPAVETINAIVHLEAERAKDADEMRDIFEAAGAIGDPEKPETRIDVAAVRLFLRMSSRDASEICDWFDSIDTVGKRLGVWDGNFADLNETE